MFGSDEAFDDGGSKPGLTRSGFLTNTARGALGVTAGGVLLSACGGGGTKTSTSGTTTAAATPEGEPVKGGLLRVAWIGGGNSETFNPAVATAPIDAFRLYCSNDAFVRAAPNFKTEPGLALTWEPNADATVYEVTFRDGVTWHDGKPFTVDDVIYTLRLMGDPKHFGHGAVTNIKLDDLKKLSATKLRVTLKQPDARLQDQFLFVNSTIVVQDGTKSYDKPIGTGPWIVESFAPGQRATFKRNPDYWDEGKPYADALQVISVDDPVARINGLLSGQFDVIGAVPYPQVASLKSNNNIKLVEAQSGPNQLIYFRIDRAPFNDPRVTLALKLIADRPGLINAAFSGHAGLLNDMAGKGLPNYNSSLPQRSQDLEQAKSLLKQAGQSDLRITLQTSPAIPGLVEAATAYAEQAKGAGVTIKTKSNPPSTYFNPAQGYLSYAAGQDSWPISSLTNFYSQTLLSDSPSNETHFGSAATDALFHKAQGATDPAKAQELWAEVQKLQYDRGGNIVWGARKDVAGTSLKVGGLVPGWFYPFGNFSSWNWWIKS